jgi:hypothetical protein
VASLTARLGIRSSDPPARRVSARGRDRWLPPGLGLPPDRAWRWPHRPFRRRGRAEDSFDGPVPHLLQLFVTRARKMRRISRAGSWLATMQHVPALHARGIRPMKVVPMVCLPGQLFILAPGRSMKMLKTVGSAWGGRATSTALVGEHLPGEPQPRAGLCRPL